MKSRNWNLALLAFALAAGAHAATAQSGGDAQAILERAGQLSSRADSNADSGSLGMAIDQKRKALKLVEEALAAGADPAKVEPGKRMIQLDLAEWLLAEKKFDEALELFRDAASSDGPGLMSYVRVRALKGQIGAEGGLGNRDAVRAILAQLIGEGRAMLAKDPQNVFLTRQLAGFLEADTFVRYWSDSGETAMRASAVETLDLFRAVATANPDSGEARRAVFVWAWVNAKMTNEIPYWKEALENGRWLRSRGELKDREALLAETERKMEKYERNGMLTLGD